MAIVLTFLVRVGVASQNENRGETFYLDHGRSNFLAAGTCELDRVCRADEC